MRTWILSNRRLENQREKKKMKMSTFNGYRSALLFVQTGSGSALAVAEDSVQRERERECWCSRNAKFCKK